jgi:hypothetical protein
MFAMASSEASKVVKDTKA